MLSSNPDEIPECAAPPPHSAQHGICYPFYIRIGPRQDIDLVSVAAQLKQLGFDLKRANVTAVKVA